MTDGYDIDMEKFRESAARAWNNVTTMNEYERRLRLLGLSDLQILAVLNMMNNSDMSEWRGFFDAVRR